MSQILGFEESVAVGTSGKPRLSYTAPHDGVCVAHPGASRGIPPYAQCLVETGEGLVEAALAVRPTARLIARFGFDILSV
jgi:hypothetical protein